jgi:competence protein ComFC
MHFILSIFNVIVEAIFPLSSEEKELFAMNEETASNVLPKSPPVPIHAYAVFAYKNDLVSKLIWNIKYKKSKQAVKIASYALFMKIHEILNKKIIGDNQKIILLPIPISKRRRRERGFNQCELLIEEIKNLQNNTKNKQNNFKLEFNSSLLVRDKHVSRQTLKHRRERLKDAKDIFGINIAELEIIKKQNQLENIIFFIIDDVITTGSTILDAEKVLRNSGAQNIILLSVAH